MIGRRRWARIRNDKRAMTTTRFAGSLLLIVCLCLGFRPASASDIEMSERLIHLHDLKTTVAIGDYYLKQEAVLAARAYLARAGREQELGAQWKPGNPYWDQAEQALVVGLMQQVHRDFSNLEWLSEEWVQMNARDFSAEDMDVLLRHFSTEVGRKQLMIVDHSVAFHVMASLSLAGKIQENLPGTEADRKRMQDLYTAEDDAMRFNHNESPEGTQFAFSPVGKKYFVNAVLKVSGLVSRRLYQTAGELPKRVDGSVPEVQSSIEAFRRARSG
jgi:hypothetical protein